MILHTFCELGAHEKPLGTQGEHANSTQKRPFADHAQGMGTDDMEGADTSHSAHSVLCCPKDRALIKNIFLTTVFAAALDEVHAYLCNTWITDQYKVRSTTRDR